MNQFVRSMYGAGGSYLSAADELPIPPLASSRFYSPQGAYFLTMLRLGHSVGPKVLVRKDFWLLLSLHLCVFVVYNNGYIDGYMDKKEKGWRLSTLELEWSDVELMFILMSCALCFAINQAYFRYLHLGHLVRKMMDSVYDFAFEARLFLRKENEPYDRLGCRWAVGSSVLVLCQILRSYKDDAVQQMDLLKLVDLEFIRPGEAEFLDPGCLSARQRTLVMMHTACDCALHGMRKADVAPATQREVLQRLVDCKSYQLQLLDAANAMLPFEYFHLLSMLVTLTVAYLGLCMGICDSWIAPLAYAASVLIILGLFELLCSLNYPFDGVHEADFPLKGWLVHFLSNLTVLLNYSHGGNQSHWEKELQAEIANPVEFPLTQEQVNSILSGEAKRLQKRQAAVSQVSRAAQSLVSAGGSSKSARLESTKSAVPWYKAAMGYKAVDTEEVDDAPLLGNWAGPSLGRMGEAFGLTADGASQSRDMHVEERSKDALW